MNDYQRGVKQMQAGNYFKAATLFMKAMNGGYAYEVNRMAREKFLSCVALDVELKV